MGDSYWLPNGKRSDVPFCRCHQDFRAEECEREHYWLFTATDKEVQRAWKAMRLAGYDFFLAQALMDGESVPVESLDPEWVKRYGVKK